MAKTRPTFCYFLLLSLVFFLSCSDDKKPAEQGRRPAQPPPLVVEFLLAENQTISADIDVPGTILANEATEIRSEISGRLTQLNIREGAIVKQGYLLAKLDDGDLQAQLRKLEIQLKIAEQTEDRQSQLLKIQGISQQDYDLSLLQVHNLKADIDIVKEAIRKTEIRAPFNGKLGLKNISPGAYITPATVITTIGQINQTKIQFNVPEKYGSLLTAGHRVEFSVDGTLKKFSAHVIATEVTIEQNTRSLAVRARVNEYDPVLIPGAFAKVKIVLSKNENSIMIPNNVILPQGRKKLVYLFKGGKAIQADVQTGVRDSSNIQILSGLNMGDTVISSGLLFLRPGADVRLAKSGKQ